MTDEIHSYLRQVMQHSGLSKQEKVDWMEEMSSHLHDETRKLVKCGHEENEATRIALQRFGDPLVVRRRISKETFGLSVRTIYIVMGVSLVLFLIDLYVLRLQFPGPWYKRYSSAWGYFLSMLLNIPASPSLMLGLCISSLTLLKTRRRADRMAIILTLAIFGVLWILIRLPLSFYLNEMLFTFKGLSPMEPYASISIGVLVLWGISMYIWTKNRWIGVLPTIISLAEGLWYLLWYDARLMPLSYLVVLILIRSIPVVVLLIVFKIVDKYWNKSALLSP